MSHEIRTPLNAIVGFSDLLSDTSGFTSEEIAQFIGTINKNCGLLLALINDILDLSRIESGTMEFMFAEHNLPLLLKTVHDSQRLNMPPGVELVLRMPESDKKYLTTDNVRLQQVVNNLINNAAKFTSSGSLLSAMKMMRFPATPASLWRIPESVFLKKVSVIYSNDSIKSIISPKEQVWD